MSILGPQSNACGVEYISPIAEEIARLEQEINTAIRKTRKGDVVNVRVGAVALSGQGPIAERCDYSHEAIKETMKRCEAAGWSCPHLEHSAETVVIRLVPPSRRQPADSGTPEAAHKSDGMSDGY